MEIAHPKVGQPLVVYDFLLYFVLFVFFVCVFVVVFVIAAHCRDTAPPQVSNLYFSALFVAF
jgi:hypothetical protein